MKKEFKNPDYKYSLEDPELKKMKDNLDAKKD